MIEDRNRQYQIVELENGRFIVEQKELFGGQWRRFSFNDFATEERARAFVQSIKAKRIIPV